MLIHKENQSDFSENIFGKVDRVAETCPVDIEIPINKRDSEHLLE